MEREFPKDKHGGGRGSKGKAWREKRERDGWRGGGREYVKQRQGNGILCE